MDRYVKHLRPLVTAGKNLPDILRLLPRHPAPWLIVLAVLLTSATIAAIHAPTRSSGSSDTAVHREIRTATPPPQSITFSNHTSVDTQASQNTVSSGNSEGIEISRGKVDAITNSSITDNTSAKTGWRTINIVRGDAMMPILKREGQPSTDLIRIIHTHPQAKALHRLIPGNTLKLRIREDKSIEELVYHIDDNEKLRLSRWPDGFHISRETRQLETRLAYATGVIETSLFEDGQAAGLSDALIMKLVEIFGWDIDFALDLRAGDTFSVIYEEKNWRGQKIADGRILATEFVSQGKPHRAIAHRDVEGITNYYTPTGVSMRRQFLRTPVEFSRISSRYSSGRYHPILKRWRAHKGVDYAARPGTPVRATARGRVVFRGWKGGYGNAIIIRHGSRYNTLYGHLLRFNKKIRTGGWVEQGQIIGYVGKTGLATGPHLHYEFQVHGKHHNPLTFKFPGSARIASKYQKEFLEDAGIWSAKLNLIGRNLVAGNVWRTATRR